MLNPSLLKNFFFKNSIKIQALALEGSQVVKLERCIIISA